MEGRYTDAQCNILFELAQKKAQLEVEHASLANKLKEAEIRKTEAEYIKAEVQMNDARLQYFENYGKALKRIHEEDLSEFAVVPTPPHQPLPPPPASPVLQLSPSKPAPPSRISPTKMGSPTHPSPLVPLPSTPIHGLLPQRPPPSSRIASPQSDSKVVSETINSNHAPSETKPRSFYYPFPYLFDSNVVSASSRPRWPQTPIPAQGNRPMVRGLGLPRTTFSTETPQRVVIDDSAARQLKDNEEQIEEREVEKAVRGTDPGVQDAQQDTKSFKKRQRGDSDPLQWAEKRQKSFLERKVESKDWSDIGVEDENDL